MTHIESAVDGLFHNSPSPTRTETEKQLELDFISMLGNVKACILSICAAVVFAIVLVSANTMAMSIRERTREVALLRTLGFTRKLVLILFVGEGLHCPRPAECWESCTAYGLVYRLAHSSGSVAGILKVTPPPLLFVLVVAALVGFLSVMAPAYRASRMNIVEACAILAERMSRLSEGLRAAASIIRFDEVGHHRHRRAYRPRQDRAGKGADWH